MEEEKREGRGEWRWWALASTLQLGWGVYSYRKGYSGNSHLMPFKAFAVASLFVSSATSASLAALSASGIHNVQDLVQLGADIRSGLGIRSKQQDD